MPRKSLHQHCADQIASALRADRAYAPTTIGELAQQWGTSYSTMHKAVHVLVDNGLIECFRGRRISRAGVGDATLPAKQRESLLTRTIADAIRTGTYRVGTPLPKVEYFVQTNHASRLTIVVALRALERRSAIHKQGKRWIVGPRVTQNHVPRPDHTSPTVVLVIPRSSDAHVLFNDAHLLPFSTRFSAELASAGIRMVLAEAFLTAADAKVRASAIDGIGQLIRRLKRRFRGALVHLGSETDVAAPLSTMLHVFGKPVVHFDSTGTEKERFPERFRQSGRYHRLFFDEQRAVSLALDTLCRAGHRRIGCAWMRGVDWMQRRVDILRECAASHPAHPELIAVVHTEVFWNTGLPFQPPFRARAALASGVRTEDLSPTQLLRATPSLSELLHGQATALIAINEVMGIEYCQWCAIAGVALPKRLSMLSLGNSPQSTPYCLSCVDFGFDRLGYLAAHLFVNDIPVGSGKRGSIPGACALVDRGTLA